jgi:hypothetical protein
MFNNWRIAPLVLDYALLQIHCGRDVHLFHMPDGAEAVQDGVVGVDLAGAIHVEVLAKLLNGGVANGMCLLAEI